MTAIPHRGFGDEAHAHEDEHAHAHPELGFLKKYIFSADHKIIGLPFLNGLAFWSAFPAGSIMLVGFFLVGGHAAAGWTSYPPLSAIIQNTAYATSGLGSYDGNFLRIAHSTWPMAPVIMVTFSMFM